MPLVSSVPSITYAMGGGRGNKDLIVTVNVFYSPAVPQANATVNANITLNGSLLKAVTGVTNENGSVSFTLKNVGLPGLPPPMAKTNTVAGVTSGHGSLTASVDPLGSEGGDEEKPPATDATLDETEAILVDYLHLLDKVVTAKK